MDIYGQLTSWVERDLSRFNATEELLRDMDGEGHPEKGEHYTLRLHTSRHQYTITASEGYLGCIARTRYWRAGEDWHRGSDLADGPFSEDTWKRIVRDIVSYELVSPVETPEPRALPDETVEATG